MDTDGTDETPPAAGTPGTPATPGSPDTDVTPAAPGASGAAAGGPVVIVGAGQAGAETAAALRDRGFTGPVTLVGDEPGPPYGRPPLSKGYLTGSVDPGGLALRPPSYYRDHGITLTGRDPAVEIDRDGQRLTLASGRELPYAALVLATGARPRPLPVPGAGLSGVLALRSLEDATAIRDRLADARDVLVIGGGFIGLEVAATARRSGARVTVVEAGPRLMARAVSGPMSAFLAGHHREQGVRVLLGREVTALRGDTAGRCRAAELDGGERVPADLVVAGIGVLPNCSLAAAAGLAVGDGVLVDDRLRTSDRAVYAVGDCARFPSPYAPGRLRLESVRNAVEHARRVAAVLCGDTPPPAAVPWFWSEQYALRLQIAGITQGHDRTAVAGDPAAGRFSVLCFRGERLVGTESVNRPADHMATRRLLESGAPGPAPADAERPGFDLKAFTRSAQPV